VNRVAIFEDLIAWQKARVLTRLIYKVTQQGAFAKDFDLSRQIRRSAVSVMSNIAEGFERGGRAEFHQFFSTAKGSCAELRCQLYIALDAGYLSQPQFDEALALSEEVTRILTGLRTSVERQRDEQRGKKCLSPQS
jgi:four helix bundle protein